MPALTADIAFEQAANAAAAHFETRPAYVTYVSHTHVAVPSMNQFLDVNRRVMVRSADDVAILQDLPHGGQSIAHGFPISPTFDALSYFRLKIAMGSRKRVFTDISGPDGGQIVPLQFQTVTHNENDVIVTSLRYYYPKFAPDSSDAPNGRTHLIMQALPTLTNGNSSDFYISDVTIDNATMLPTQVTYTGRDDRRFVVDYETIGNAWVISHAFFEMTQYGVLHIGRVHWTADATYTDYQFSQTPPDPRLAPK
jgi:hypothetical protein